MRIVVSQYERISPFVILFRVHNRVGRLVLKEIKKKYLDTTDLYALKKLGFKIIIRIHK